MSNPKEKAEELIYKFEEFANDNYHECSLQYELKQNRLDNAKQCALICIDELIECIDMTDTLIREFGYDFSNQIQFYNEVKNELNKL